MTRPLESMISVESHKQGQTLEENMVRKKCVKSLDFEKSWL